MSEADFLNRWRAEKPLYEAWANFISMKIHEGISSAIHPVPIDYFLKVPVKPRLKTDSTLIDKAFHRKKYLNPYDDVTDKVGMRFVVLLTTDIRKVCGIIDQGEACGWWDASKDRDYEIERLEKPLEFSYQSVHYVLRSKQGIAHEEMEIPAGTTCEIQIRTLLQHAHSELTHDTLYKPKTTAKPDVKRTVAKSMALIEATDEFFEQAIKNLDEAGRPQRELLKFLAEKYQEATGQDPGKEFSNELVIDAILDLCPTAPYDEISRYLTEKPYIFDRIKAQLGSRHLFSQPVVLLAYYLADTNSAQLQSLWPLDQEDLIKIYSDLGKRFI